MDGGLIGTDTNGGDGWSTTWDTATVADGNHTLEATATDDAEQIDTDGVTVTVENTPSGSVEILMVVGNVNNTHPRRYRRPQPPHRCRLRSHCDRRQRRICPRRLPARLGDRHRVHRFWHP